MNEKTENDEKMSFKDYFDSLITEESNAIRDTMLASSEMGYTTFYDKLRLNKWKPLEIKELERITNQSFKR